MGKAIIVAATILVSAGAALAQQPAGPPAGGGWHHAHMMGMCRDMDARLAALLAYDEVRLGITQAQMPAWRKLGDTLKAAQEPVRRACATSAQQQATTLPARLDEVQKMVEAQAASMRTAFPAIEQFYATLSPEQKQVADEMTEHGGGMMMMHGHGWGGP